jgi:hypothetical protein
LALLAPQALQVYWVLSLAIGRHCAGGVRDGRSSPIAVHLLIRRLRARHRAHQTNTARQGDTA